MANESLKASMAANEGWARCEDRTQRTAPGRAAFEARFVKQVDPDGVLSPDELRKRVNSARVAYFQRLAIKSAESRRRRNGAA